MISNEVKGFVRDIEICDIHTFYDLHMVIQKDLHYDNSQLSSFFTTNSLWEKEQEFTLFDLTDDEKVKAIPMDKAFIKDIVKSDKQRILYVFDFFNERAFFLELMDSKEETHCSGYPKISLSGGSPPPQILLETNLPESIDFNEE